MLGMNNSITTISMCRRRPVAFSPASLSGLVAWYVPSEISTLFQDVEGTMPVQSDGDPVGLMVDKSGNGNHVYQSNVSARPIFRSSGQLEFDGVDDRLETAHPIVVPDSPVFMGCAFQHTMLPTSGNGGIMSDARFRKGGILLGWEGGCPAIVHNNMVSERKRTFTTQALSTRHGVMGAFVAPTGFHYQSDAGELAETSNVFATATSPLWIGQGTQGGRFGLFAGCFSGGVYASCTENEARGLVRYLQSCRR
ncbi:hypothetical protein [Thalassorhabdomicrobium marinisediminis]|uniref:hypothetical protein n=1 Tax=Thalassorhabdomicrobium marinisediminis TaxID=2170577 RepID=UPI002491C1C3|nr:hypothetical protein [Thalassorhabdomicrobium marinisediminis]